MTLRTTQLKWGNPFKSEGGRVRCWLTRITARGRHFPDDEELQQIFAKKFPGVTLTIVERRDRALLIETPGDHADKVWNVLLPEIAKAMDAPGLAKRAERKVLRGNRKQRQDKT